VAELEQPSNQSEHPNRCSHYPKHESGSSCSTIQTTVMTRLKSQTRRTGPAVERATDTERTDRNGPVRIISPWCNPGRRHYTRDAGPAAPRTRDTPSWLLLACTSIAHRRIWLALYLVVSIRYVTPHEPEVSTIEFQLVLYFIA
jgi:hypothetical protein